MDGGNCSSKVSTELLQESIAATTSRHPDKTSKVE